MISDIRGCYSLVEGVAKCFFFVRKGLEGFEEMGLFL